MLRFACPTGCAGFVRRPYPRRAEPVRCPNCRAWLAAPDRVEDGGLVEAVLLAAPGHDLPPPRRSVARPHLKRGLVAALVLAASIAAAALVQGARAPAARANDTRSAPTITRSHPSAPPAR